MKANPYGDGPQDPNPYSGVPGATPRGTVDDSAGQNGRGGRGLQVMLRALGSRNYRLFFSGQLVSLVGTWLTNVATAWLVYRLTHSTVQLGVVAFASQIPAFLFAPLAGVLVDRWRLRRVLVVTQTLAMLESAALAVLTLGGWITVGWIYGLCVFQGLVNAFDMPARQAFVVQMVDRPEDLPNAIALNSSMFNVARLLGPAVAGVLIAAFGEGICFSIDAVSYVGVIVALLMMQVAVRPQRVTRDVVTEFKAGLGYAWNFKPMRAILLLLAWVSLVAVPVSVLMPVFAKDVLHGDARTLGFLTAASGVGALLGALRLAARSSVLGLGRIIPLASAGLGLGLIAFSFSHWLWLSIGLMAVTGFCMVTQMAGGNTLLQTLVDDDKRGRVMSLFMLSFAGMTPVGSLLMGVLTAPGRLGVTWTVASGGACCIVGAGAFWAYLPTLRKHVRPLYVQRGILPAIASGLQTAANVEQVVGE